MKRSNRGRYHSFLLSAFLVGSIFAFGGVNSAMAKEASSLVTATMRGNAIRNAERYDWAQAQRANIVRQAEKWLDKSDRELWGAVPSPDFPRNSSANRDGIGCPNCGKEQFTQRDYWGLDMDKRPWKIWCNNCHEVFPTNDFGAYYKSALDEHGVYHQGAGDKTLLYNEEHPDPEDPLHMYGVDDGLGFTNADGQQWTFIALYGYHRWIDCIRGAKALAEAYTLTDDMRYAHKCGILLARIADFYPEIDYNPQVHRRGFCISCGGSGKGRIQGTIWECFTATDLATAYDTVYDALKDDAELAASLNGLRAERGLEPTGDIAAVCKHIETDLLMEFGKSVYDGRIHGNPGMHQLAMVATAIALDDPEMTPEYLDWVFAEDGGEVPKILVDILGREGLGYEAGLGYCTLPGQSLYSVAEMLRKYGKYDHYDMYRDFPKFKKCFTLMDAVRILDASSAKIGDAGKTQNYGAGGGLDLDMALTGYRAYGESLNALEVGQSCLWEPERLRGDIYDADPDGTRLAIEAEWAKRPERLSSFNSGGYGLGVLQTPYADYGTAAYLYYGRSIFHGHLDRLSFGILSKNIVINPDLAYPQYTGAWPKRIGWVHHTVSHNTVMVNDKGQKAGWGGKTLLFEGDTPARVMIADGGDAYESCTTYQRALALVDVSEDDSYVFDLFWVRGGSNHRMINNGAAPEVTYTGLQLVKQEKGTYAGPDVEFGEFYDGPQNWDYDGSGFMYLYNVEKGTGETPFMVDWDCVDKRGYIRDGADPHLRMYCLTGVDEIAIASGDPPRNSPGNPDSLRYVLRSRFGEDLETEFVTVHEPYDGEPFIAEVRRLDVEGASGSFAGAVEIRFVDGRRDVVIMAEKPGSYAAGGIELQGQFGLVRFDADGRIAIAKLTNGTVLRSGDFSVTQPVGSLSGELVSVDVSNPNDVRLRLSEGVDATGLAGRYIIFDNAERSDASYRIERVVDEHTVSIGDITLQERHVDENDYSAGIVNNVVPGEKYNIVLSTTVTW